MPLLSNPGPLEPTTRANALGPRAIPFDHRYHPHLTSEQQMRQLVLLAFDDPLPRQCAQLRHLSQAQWRRLLYWLDTSGLALYLLARLSHSNRLDWLPGPVRDRLAQNLADNTERNHRLLAECVDIHQRFERGGISHCLLKGISLWPSAVSSPELRSQLDLDFLVAGRNILEAQRILENMGYHLHAVSGRSYEFKTPHPPSLSIKALYKPHMGRCVELHVESESSPVAMLPAVETRTFGSLTLPVLPSVELFVGQALHLHKHVCSESFRCSHLLEYHRAVVFHSNDDAFWRKVRTVYGEDYRVCLALGVITLLTTDAIGPFAPTALACWTVDQLPSRIRLWVEVYGLRCVYANFPGSKLYLLLQRELEAEGVIARRSTRRSLVPLRLPPPIARRSEHETVLARMHHTVNQLRFILFRLRFHLFEGLRFAWESQLWRHRADHLQK